MLAGELRLRALSSELGRARDYVRDAARRFGFDPRHVYELVYAANEAVTNAIRHGTADAAGCITVEVRGEDDRLTLLVRDSGTFVEPTQVVSTTPEHGRGFALMASLVDDVRVSAEPGRTTIELSKALAPLAVAAARTQHA